MTDWLIRRRAKHLTRVLLNMGLLLFIITACTLNPAVNTQFTTTSGITETTEIQTTPTTEATPLPGEGRKDPEAPLDPVGSKNNPIIMGFVSATGDALAEESGATIAQAIAEQTGLNVESRMHTEYSSLLDEMKNGSIHFAWLPPLTYLSAQKAGYAEAGLISNHFGVYSYGFQLLAHRDSSFTVYFNPETNQSTSNAAVALGQFHQKRPCWVEPSSPSGYVIPLGFFNTNGIVLLDGVIVQSHAAVIRALYAKEICDFGVTYATYGDPRTASSVMADIPNVMEQVIVLWQSDPVIPNLNVSFLTSVSAADRQLISDTLVGYAKTEEGKAALSTANDYDIDALKIIDDSFYADLRNYYQASGIPLAPLVGK